MGEVRIFAFSEARRLLGWGEKSVLLTVQTVGQFLSEVKAADGRSLEEVLTTEGRVRDGFAILINHELAGGAGWLQKSLQQEDQLLVVEIIHGLAGG